MTVENLLIEDGENFHLKTTAKEPLPGSYKPELHISPELNDALTSRFQQLIGILRLAVELGRVDIYYEAAILSQYLALPREGHLEGAYHIFAYVEISGLVFPTCTGWRVSVHTYLTDRPNHMERYVRHPKYVMESDGQRYTQMILIMKQQEKYMSMWTQTTDMCNG